MTDPDSRRRALLGIAAMAPLLTASTARPALPDTGHVPEGAAGGSRGAGVILATDHGAIGDGETDDHGAIRRAIAAARAQGGGTVLLPHPGPWLVSAPVDMESDVILTGVTQNTMLRRQGGGRAGGAGDAVVRAEGKVRFRIANLTLVGTRPPGSGPGGPPACDGLALKGCGYFDVDNVRADYCREGFRLANCYTFGIAQATALRCASYGYSLTDSCTSFVLRNTTSWACGGGWRIAASVYGSLIGCACDLSDAGGKPGDPFGDSGGDYRRPGFIFDLSGSKGISIVAPGCELGNSPWLYCEGTQATILNPYLYGMEAHSADWRLIQLRGTGYSNVTIVNPFGFDSVANHGGATRAIMIEDPSRQRLYLSGRWRVNGFEDPGAYPADGLVVEGMRTLLDYSQASMAPGGVRLLSADGRDQAGVVVEDGIRQVRLQNGGGGVFSLPVPGEGLFQLKALGRCSVAGGAILSLERRAGGDPVRAWRGQGTGIAIDQWFYVPPDGDSDFTIRLQAGARAELDLLMLNCVEGQF